MDSNLLISLFCVLGGGFIIFISTLNKKFFKVMKKNIFWFLITFIAAAALGFMIGLGDK